MSSASQDGRDEVLQALEDAIFECQRKAVGNGRIRSAEKESVRIKYINAMSNAARVYTEVKSDTDLEEMSAAIERLQAAAGQPPASAYDSGD